MSGGRPLAQLLQDMPATALRGVAGSVVAIGYSLLLSAYMIIDKKRIGISIRCSGP
jgi:hypothetical protein